nr:hypothetical protein [uncultured Desulfuromonas sp.]
MKRKSRHLPSAQEALSIELTQKAIRQLTYSKRVKLKASVPVDNKSNSGIEKGGILVINVPGATLRIRNSSSKFKRQKSSGS